MEEKISIIVPVYNAAATLERCVDALAKQTYQNIEIILANDGSQDDSSLICHRYADSDERITVIDKENGGVSSARNAGLDVATGEYVMFCDSDDWVEPDWCEVLINHYSDKDLVMCGVFVEGDQQYYPYKVCARNCAEHYKREDIESLKHKFFPVPWNKIFSRKIIDDNAITFDTNISNGEDYIFNMKYLNCICGEVVFLSVPGIHYSWPRETNLSSRVGDTYFLECELWGRELCEEAAVLLDNDFEKMKFFYTEIFDRYQRGLEFLMKDQMLSGKCILHKMNNVKKSDMYQACVHRAEFSSNRFSLIFWKLKNCYALFLWINMSNLLKRRWK